MFNREEFIEEAINSILNQTYKQLDIIVYDDGSTDQSVNIVKNLMKKDKRIRLFQGTQNKGVGYARNQLLRECNTKYACWQDSDDISNSKRIELQIKSQKQGNYLVFTRWGWLYKMGKQWKERLKNTDAQAFATVLFPVNKTIKFDESKQFGGEDWCWLSRMKKKYNELEVEEIKLYYVRFHEDRIGAWKRKTRFNDKFPKELLNKLSYKEIIEYYKKHYE